MSHMTDQSAPQLDLDSLRGPSPFLSVFVYQQHLQLLLLLGHRNANRPALVKNQLLHVQINDQFTVPQFISLMDVDVFTSADIPTTTTTTKCNLLSGSTSPQSGAQSLHLIKYTAGVRSNLFIRRHFSQMPSHTAPVGVLRNFICPQVHYWYNSMST